MYEYAILYRHNKCGKLSASKLILEDNQINNISNNIQLKAKHIRKYCNNCEEYITKPNYLYNAPMFLEIDKLYDYLLKQDNLYKSKSVTKK